MPPSAFEFSVAPATAVYVCGHVKAGAPILAVYHDRDGDWQFLCGGEHDEDSGEEPVLVSLDSVVRGDPTLNELARMCEGNHAERPAPGASWLEVDDSETFITDTVKSHGWSVQMVPAGEGEEEPEFAYTVGLWKTFEHPEILVRGLPLEDAAQLLDACGERLRAGEPLPTEIADTPIRFHRVSERASYDEHVGYAIWFNQGREFPLLQLVWSPTERVLP